MKIPSFAYYLRNRARDALVKVSPGQSSSQVSRDHVIWAYRLLLEREPDSEQVIAGQVTANPTIKRLRTTLLTSPEFRLKNPEEIPYSMESNIVIKELEHGLRLLVDLADVVIGLNIVRGSFERSELAFIRSTLKSGQTAIDLGANIGFFTMNMAKLVGPAGKVYAFEPLPRNAELTRRSMLENGFEDRVTLEQAAAGDTPGKGHLLYFAQVLNSGGSYLTDRDRSVPDGHALTEVDIVALDQFKLRRPVHFIKMDIEGSEPLAMRGAEEILAQDRPIVSAELNPDTYPRVSGITPTDFVNEMDGRGYDCHLLENGQVGKELRQADELCTSIFLPRKAR